MPYLSMKCNWESKNACMENMLELLWFHMYACDRWSWYLNPRTSDSVLPHSRSVQMTLSLVSFDCWTCASSSSCRLSFFFGLWILHYRNHPCLQLETSPPTLCLLSHWHLRCPKSNTAAAPDSWSRCDSPVTELWDVELGFMTLIKIGHDTSMSLFFGRTKFYFNRTTEWVRY